jgi:hypothetical protein
VNAYTRREELVWTLVSAFVLLLSGAAAVVLALTIEGPLVPDLAAQEAARVAEGATVQAAKCTQLASKLETELTVFQTSAKTARLDAPEPTPEPPKPPPGPRRPEPKKPEPPQKGPEVEFAWPSAQNMQKLVKQVVPCRAATEAASKAPDAAAGWAALEAAAAVELKPEPRATQLESARALLRSLEKAPLGKVAAHTQAAQAAVKAAADQARTKADTAKVRAPLPSGLLPRKAAVGAAAGLFVVVLLISFMSLRVASRRRLHVLAPLRDAARQGRAGDQAVALLRLAGQSNGGEPGLMAGAGLGALGAALLNRADPDLLVAGTMAGLVVGLVLQYLVRSLTVGRSWRRRVLELGDIEKPALSMVLVMKGVEAGREGEFVGFISRMSDAEAAVTVDRLAAQAEERILVEAELARGASP